MPERRQSKGIVVILVISCWFNSFKTDVGEALWRRVRRMERRG